MTSVQVLLVDPVDLRRERLRRCVEATPGVTATAVATLSEAYMMAESQNPQAVALAAELAIRPEFEGFLALARMLRTRLALFGDPRLLPRGARCQRLDSEADYATLSCEVTGTRPPVAARAARAQGLMLIGASTGGTIALETLLSALPADVPPTVIVQHMREGFIDGMIRRLDRDCAAEVLAAPEGEVLRPGRVYIAADPACHLTVTGRAGALRLRHLAGDPVSGHRPSVDVLFASAAEIGTRPPTVAALLTGMGGDGADGMVRLRRSGAHTIAQDQATSVVWGMPRLAVEMGGAEEVLPITRIGPAMLAALSRPAETGAPR
ncbi:MAG TPA: CheB methylesterase domain-containing protein [Paracoccaceae bacterium]|nr:CheB methylesterase domain-containing protein [Paracoccaceae bacterium]